MLNVGDTAPDFSLPDQDGNIFSLKAQRGKKVLVWFFPKASTPGCTAQGCMISRVRSAAIFAEERVRLVHISCYFRAIPRAGKECFYWLLAGHSYPTLVASRVEASLLW